MSSIAYPFQTNSTVLNLSSSKNSPLSSNNFSSASLTGLISPNASIVLNNPGDYQQTINSPKSPPSPQISVSPPSPQISVSPPSPKISPNISPSPKILVNPPSPQISINTSFNTQSSPEKSKSPSAKSAINIVKKSTLNTNVAEIMTKDFEIKDYQGIINNSSLEKELLNAGYAPLSKIVVRSDIGDKKTQYIKAINKKGQQVFVYIDVNGYTTARATDLTLIESHNASIVPYSVKTGAYNCANKDVCGVAFECGTNSICVLSRGTGDLNPKEANFVYVEQPTNSAISIETEGSIMSYPVIRLSEIRANPSLVLKNTDLVTRRLRNATYTSELQSLAAAEQSISKLNLAFNRFNKLRDVSAEKLNRTLTTLEQWNDFYLENPPTTDETKDKYRKLQFNLSHRNECISTLLRSMKKVADTSIILDKLTNNINEITDYCETEFQNIEFAISE